jgi:PEGA domain
MRMQNWAATAASNRSIRVTIITTVLALVSSCSVDTVCTAELRSVLQLDALDSVTRAPAAGGATAWLRGGSLVDSVTVPDTATSSLIYEWFEDRVKAGTYTVQVQKPGYREWTQTNIRVNANACHTTTFEHLTALLQR